MQGRPVPSRQTGDYGVALLPPLRRVFQVKRALAYDQSRVAANGQEDQGERVFKRLDPYRSRFEHVVGQLYAESALEAWQAEEYVH